MGSKRTIMERKRNGIDRKALGGYLRALRKHAGYRSTGHFSEALLSKAGYRVREDAIYRIESGKQEAPLSYLCAASIVCNGKVLSFSVESLIRASACEEWQRIEERTEL